MFSSWFQSSELQVLCHNTVTFVLSELVTAQKSATDLRNLCMFTGLKIFSASYASHIYQFGVLRFSFSKLL